VFINDDNYLGNVSDQKALEKAVGSGIFSDLAKEMQKNIQL